MAKTAQYIKPNINGFNKATTEFIQTVKHIGNAVENVADFLDSLVTTAQDVTEFVDDVSELINTNSSVSNTSHNNSSNTNIVVELLTKIMKNDQSALNELADLLFTELTNRNIVWSSDQVTIFKNQMLKHLAVYKDNNNKTLLNLFSNKNQLVSKAQEWFNEPDPVTTPSLVKVTGKVDTSNTANSIIRKTGAIRNIDTTSHGELIATSQKIKAVTKITTNQSTSVSEVNPDVLDTYIKATNVLTDNNCTTSINDDATVKRTIISVTKQSTLKGLIGAYTAFDKKYLNHPVLLEASYELLMFAIQHKYPDLVSEIINGSVANQLMLLLPEIDELLLKNVSIDKQLGEQHYVTHYARLRSGLDKMTTNLNLTTSSTVFTDLVHTMALTNDVELSVDPIAELNDEAYLAAADLTDPWKTISFNLNLIT
jgi:hypothetical protein